MSEQTDDTTPTTRTRRNKIGAMRASPSLTAAAGAAPKRRGRPPKQASATNAKDSSAGTVAAAQPKRSLAHARLIARVDALVQEHDVKRIGKLLDAVQGLR